MNLCKVEAREVGGQGEGMPVPGRVLVLGLGNDILTDDAAGLMAARLLRERLAGNERVVVGETMEMGLSLLDLVEGYEGLVLVDAVVTGKAVPGTVHVFGGEQLDAVPGMAPHGLGVGEVLAAGAALGLAVPRRVCAVGLEVEDPFTLGLALTPAVERAMPGFCERVERVVNRMVGEMGAGLSNEG